MIDRNQIPASWEVVKLGEVCEVVRGGSPRPMGNPKYFTGNIPFLKIADVTKVEEKFVFDSETKVNELGAEKSRLLKKGSLVLTNSGTVCIPKFLGVDACIHDGFLAFLNFKSEFNQDFLFYYFNHIRPFVIQKHKQGVTQVNLNTEIVKDFDIPLIPLPEQHRIVSKIEELFSELDKGIESLKTARQQLKIYRQAVLKWAFEGRLTHENVKDGELPEGWRWNTIRDVCTSVEYGSAAKSKEKGKVPVLRMGNIQNGRFDWSDLVYTDDDDEIKKYLLKKGDVLFNRTNSPELVGKTAIYKGERKAIFAGYLIRINRIEGLIDADYLNYYLNTHAARTYGNSVRSFGVNQSNINGTKLKTYPIPIPPLAEQYQIVQEIETRLSVCDKLEETITTALQQNEALRQSILKKAFEGKLVAQDPKDEPPSKLLEGIKAEKTKNKVEMKKIPKG